jgi:tRNA dimethylallyltransferase
MKELAIIGPTASGKSALAASLAQQFGAVILSLDSLAIYRHIDILSAKPTRQERGTIPHYGIDLIDPDETFSAAAFMALYQTTKKACEKAGKKLIIVGGSSFYLKSILEGLSDEPDFSDTTRQRVKALLLDPPKAHAFLEANDPEAAAQIAPNDRFRLEKALLIHIETGNSRNQYYAKNPKLKPPNNIRLFEISVEREVLKARIRERTRQMLKNGGIDEAAWLEQRYGRAPSCMGSIGIREILEFFDGKIARSDLEEQISIHTAQFAKRQSTFNAHQFEGVTKSDPDGLRKTIEAYLT